MNGIYQKFITDKDSQIYVVGKDDRLSVLSLSQNSGELNYLYSLPEGKESVFMDGQGQLYYVKYVPELNQRCWVKYDQNTEREVFSACHEQMYGLLAIPVATDDDGRGYGVQGMKMGCLDQNNSIVWEKEIQNVVIDSLRNYIYTSQIDYSDSSRLIQIDRWVNGGSFGEEIKLNIPNDIWQKYQSSSWKLIDVDREGNLYILGESPNRKSVIITYNSSGSEVLNINWQPTKLYSQEFRLQGANSWGVDGEGNLYLPVLGKEEFYVLKLQLTSR